MKNDRPSSRYGLHRKPKQTRLRAPGKRYKLTLVTKEYTVFTMFGVTLVDHSIAGEDCLNDGEE